MSNINSIININLYNLRSNLIDGIIPEQNIRQLAKTAKTALEQARSMSLELINEAIASYPPVTENTIMFSWYWDHKRVPEIFREVSRNVWFKDIDDVNIIDILECFVDYENTKVDNEIIGAIYSAIHAAQKFFRSYDRIKAVIENQ